MISGELADNKNKKNKGNINNSIVIYNHIYLSILHMEWMNCLDFPWSLFMNVQS